MPTTVHKPQGERLPSDRRSLTGGFTIAEVAMSMLVLAMAISTALIVMQRTNLAIDTARNLSTAGSIMQCEMEKERLFTWTQVSDSTYQPTIDPSLLRNPAVAGRFTLSRTLASLSNHSSQMVQITLTVTWRSYDGHSLTRSYTTYYCQKGLYNYIYAHN